MEFDSKIPLGLCCQIKLIQTEPQQNKDAVKTVNSFIHFLPLIHFGEAGGVTLDKWAAHRMADI